MLTRAPDGAAAEISGGVFTAVLSGTARKRKVRRQADLCRAPRTLKQPKKPVVVRKNKEEHRKVPVQKPMAVLKMRQAAR